MDTKHTNPNANVPKQGKDDPLGDRGPEGKTWTPPSGSQGISNREDDEQAPDRGEGRVSPRTPGQAEGE